MAKDLTSLAVEKAQPGASRREIPDGHSRGLFLVVQPTGRKSWAFRYRRLDGLPRKLTIGAYPDIDLAAARRHASKARSTVAEQGDPAADLVRAKKAARVPKDYELVEKVVERFLERHAKAKTRPATYRESERILNKEIVERWRGKPLSTVTRSDMHALLDEIVDRGSPIAANRSLGAIRPLFRWAVEREIIAASPCEGIRPPAAPKERDRVLGDDELRAIWKAAERLGYPFGPIIQLLIVTGQRRDEVAGATWSEFDFASATWTLPPGRVKNAKGHTVPLSTLAISILGELPRVASASGYLFTHTGRTFVSGFANAKERLDRFIADVGDQLSPWVLHDLRRSMATGCARLGVAPQVVEAILNHKSGTIRGVAAVYNRYDHATEKRVALELWARHVEAIVSGKPASNVIELKAVGS